MKPYFPLAACVCALACGCTHEQLRRSALNTTATLTEMQYQQVLDNLAMFVQNPGSLPFFALNSKGNVQISDSLANNGGLAFMAHHFTSGTLGIGPGSRAVTENWDLQPALTPGKLVKMRCLYQAAIGQQASDCQDCNSVLPALERKDQCGIPRCFFETGGRLSVPLGAAYVGRYKGTYVWVMPEQVDALSRLTLRVLDIASENDGVTPAQMYAAGVAAPVSGTGTTPYDGTPRLNPYAPSSGIQFFPNSSPR